MASGDKRLQRERNLGCGFSTQRKAINIRYLQRNEGNVMRVENIVVKLRLIEF